VVAHGQHEMGHLANSSSTLCTRSMWIVITVTSAVEVFPASEVRAFSEPQLRDSTTVRIVALAQAKITIVLGIDAGQSILAYAATH